MDTTTIIISLAAIAVAGLLGMLVLRRRRRPEHSAEKTREDLAAIAEHQRTHGGREHGQNVSSNRWADGGGWGG